MTIGHWAMDVCTTFLVIRALVKTYIQLNAYEYVSMCAHSIKTSSLAYHFSKIEGTGWEG